MAQTIEGLIRGDRPADAAAPRNEDERALLDRARDLRRAGKKDEAAVLIRRVARQRVIADRNANGVRVGPITIPPRVLAFTQGAGNGAVVGDYVAAGADTLQQVLSGKPADYGANLRDESAVRRGVADAHPAEALAGEVTGAIATLPVGGAATKAVGGVAARVAPRTVATVARVVAPATTAVERAARGGSTAALARAVARTAPAAAVSGAVQGGAEGFARNTDVGEGLEGAGKGAAVAAVAAPAIRAVAAAARPVIAGAVDRIAPNNALRAIAREVDPATAKNAMAQYAREVGTPAALGQVIEPTAAQEAGRLVASTAPSAQLASEAAEALRVDTQRRVADRVLPGSSRSGNVTSAMTTQALDKIRNVRINVGKRDGKPVLDFLTRPNVQAAIRSMPPEEASRFANAIDYQTPLRVGDMENLRLALNKLQKDGAGFGYGDLAREAVNIADGRTNGGLSRILDLHGRNATRSAVAEAALKSPSAAEGVARRLATGAGAARDLSASLGAAEAARLQRLGKSVTRSADNLQTIAPSPVRTPTEDTEGIVQLASRLAFAGKTGGAGLASLTAYLSRLKAGPGGATRLAKALLDPKEANAAIAEIERLGMRREQITGFLNRAAVALGGRTGSAVADARPAEAKPAAPADAPAGATEDELFLDLRTADASGDEAKAKEIAQRIKAMRATAAEAGRTAPTPEEAAATPPSDEDTEEYLFAQLKKADANGDDEAARRIALTIKNRRDRFTAQ